MPLNQTDYQVMLKKPREQSGFTLLELMITLTIAGILIGIAIPSFISTISGNRLTTYTNELVTAINLARNESIKRGEIVVVRKMGTNWDDGWRVFVDVDRSTASNKNTYQAGANSTLCESGEDCLLRDFSALPSPYTLDGDNNFSNFISYKPSGELNIGSGNFVVCDNSDSDNVPESGSSRLITVNSIGRVRIGVDTDTTKDGIPNKNSGANIASCQSPF